MEHAKRGYVRPRRSGCPERNSPRSSRAPCPVSVSFNSPFAVLPPSPFAAPQLDLVMLVEVVALGQAAFNLMRIRYEADGDGMSPWIVPFLRRSLDQWSYSDDFSTRNSSPVDANFVEIQQQHARQVQLGFDGSGRAKDAGNLEAEQKHGGLPWKSKRSHS